MVVVTVVGRVTIVVVLKVTDWFFVSVFDIVETLYIGVCTVL